MIELKNIGVTFNPGSKLENKVINCLNLKIEQGEFVTIIGGNGAGKSTLMNVLAGNIIPHTGEVIIEDNNVTRMPTAARSLMVARVFQDPMLGTYADLTIEENMSIAYKRGQHRGLALAINKNLREYFKNALSELDMNLENRLKDQVLSLSGGQRQALSLIMASLQGSKIILLDEHTAALDPKIAKLIMEITDKIIKSHHLTAIMITHSMSQALEYGTRTLMMQYGNIVKDVKNDERKNLSPEDLIQYFGI